MISILQHRPWFAVGQAALAVLLLAAGCASGTSPMEGFPPVMVWAWERPEDLRFLDCSRVGVAYLAGTLTLAGGRVSMRPRLQPLQVSQGCPVLAVVRLESWRSGLTGLPGPGAAPLNMDEGAEQRTDEEALSEMALAELQISDQQLSHRQRRAAVTEILASLPRRGVHGLQIDFDARESEREFYRALLHDLRREMPPEWPLSMTALASWCFYDDWLGGLPVDEAVPMLFHMGRDGPRIRSLLGLGEDFQAAVARGGYGLYSQETVPALRPGRRIYLFHPQSWDENALAAFLQRVQP